MYIKVNFIGIKYVIEFTGCSWNSNVIHTNVRNSKVTSYFKLPRLNNCTESSAIWHRDTLIFVEVQILLFTSISDISSE